MGKLVNLETDGHSFEGYFSEAGHDKPGVIVIQEWWGLVDHIKHLTDRFAEAGFNAFAPDLYHGQAAAEPDMAKKLAMELQLDSAAKEISRAAKYLREIGSGKVGIIGFCMGGTLSIWGATLTPEITASVAFYPGASWERHNPQWVYMKSKKVVIHCSEGDGTSAASGIQEALTSIKKNGGEAKAFDYPGTQHAFFNDDRPQVYNKEAAKLAWQRTLEFFTQNLN